MLNATTSTNQKPSLGKKIVLAAFAAAVGITACLGAATTPAHASITNANHTQHYRVHSFGSVKDNNDYGCWIPEGFAFSKHSAFTIVCNGSFNKAVIHRTDMKTNKSVMLTNTSTNSKYFTGLGHANDIAVTNDKNGHPILYVATMSEGTWGIVRIDVNGSKAKVTRHYNVQMRNSKKANDSKGISGIAVTSYNNNGANFLIKSGSLINTAYISNSAKNGSTITGTFYSRIKSTKVKVGNSYYNLGAKKLEYQGFSYHNGRIYIPVSNGWTSLVLVYDAKTIKGKSDVSPLKSPTYKIVSNHKLEMENVGVYNNKLYFNVYKGRGIDAPICAFK